MAEITSARSESTFIKKQIKGYQLNVDNLLLLN